MVILIAKRRNGSDIEQDKRLGSAKIPCVNAEGKTVSVVVQDHVTEASGNLPRYFLVNSDGWLAEELIPQQDGTLVDKRGLIFQLV